MAQSPIAITGVTVFRTFLPVVSERRQGTGRAAGQIEVLFVRLSTDAGIVGWGEAASGAAFPGAQAINFGALVSYLCPLLHGADPFRIESLMGRINKAVIDAYEAKAAIEMACFDIVGRALGVPVHALLGGAVRTRIPLSFSIANPDLDADLAMAKRLVADGIRLFKIKTGFAGHDEDLRRIERLRAIVPDDTELRVDYNQGLSPAHALRQLRDLDGLGLGFIEQPVPRHAITVMADLAAALETPIMADESVVSPEDAFRVAAAGAADIVGVKVMKGGMLKARAVASIAEAAGLPCFGGDMAESGLGHLAGTHLVAATPNISLGCEFYQATYYLKEDILAQPFPVRDGHVHVPDEPGLGIAIDEDKVRRYATETVEIMPTA
jgi:muconate cycloisomerase